MEEKILYNGTVKVNTLGHVFKNTYGEWREVGKCNTSYNNYILIWVNDNGKRRNIPAHRLIATAFIPNPENKPQVNHIDGNKHNNAVSNLEWVTRSENCRHAFRTGLYKGIQNTCIVCGGTTHNHDVGHCTCNSCRERFQIARHTPADSSKIIIARHVVAIETLLS